MEGKIIELARNIILAVSEGRTVTTANKKLIKEAADDIIAVCKQTPPTPNSNLSADAILQLKAEILSEIRTEIKSIKQSLEKTNITNNPTTSKTTYATIIKTPQPTAKKPALIINVPTPVHPTTSTSSPRAVTPKSTLEHIKSHLNFKNRTFAPAKVQSIAGGRVYLEFDTLQQQKEVLNSINTAGNLKAEEAKRRPPLAILKGIHKDTPKEELISSICTQNSIPSTDIRLCFLTTNRNSQLYNAVIETTPGTFQKLYTLGRVAVNFQQVHFEKFSRFSQCRKCLQFGHSQTKCSSALHPCAICAAEDHQGDNCPLKGTEGKKTCYNCTRHNKRTGSKLPTDHAANNQALCTRIHLAKENIDKTVDYGFAAPPPQQPRPTTEICQSPPQ